MKLEIITESGVSLSLTDDVTISLNYAIQDILDIKKRKTNFSKTINLKGDSINNLFFENIFDVNISTLSFNPRKKIGVTVREGLNTIMTGNLNLLSIDNIGGDVEYSIVIIGELSNIYKELKGKTIDFVDLSEFNHVRNKLNIIDTWDNTEGYIYPHIIYGNKDAIYNQFFVYDMQPALYVKTLFDKMITKLGYTYESVFLNSEYFKSLVLTSNNEKILKSDEVIKEQTAFVGVDGTEIIFGTYKYNNLSTSTPTGNISTTLSYPFNRETPYIAPITGTDYDFRDTLNQSFFNAGMIVENTGYYDIKSNFNAYLKFKQTSTNVGVVLQDSGGHVYSRISLMLERNDGSISELFFSNTLHTMNGLTFGISGEMVDQNTRQEMVELIQTIFLEQGDKLYFKTRLDLNELNFVDGFDASVNIDMTVNYVLFDEDPFDTINTVSRIELIPTNQSLGNEEISLNSLFDVKLDSLFSDIVKMFNIVIIEDDNKHLIIDTYDNYFSSSNIIKDWTDKIDRERSISLLPLNKLDFNKYVLKYSDGKDWLSDRYRTAYNENYGTKEIDVENDFSKKTETLKLGLESTPNSNQFMNQRSVPFLCDIVDEVTNWQFKQKKTKSRMLFIKRNEQCDEWWLRDVSGDDSTSFTDYTYVGMFDNPITPKHSLSFGTNKEEYNLLLQSVPTNNLVNEFHRNKLENIINIDSRIMTAYFNLNNLDIKEFDFRDIIFIDGSYWRVDNISNYNPLVDGVTKVTLYKLLDDLTITNINLSLDGNIQSCPSDVIISDGLYIAKDPINIECCIALGGLWNNTNNTCMVQQNIGGGDDTITDKPPLINKGNLTQHNGNTIHSPGAIVNGNNNYIGENSQVTAVLGNNNTVNSGTNNIFIAGNNIDASQSNTTYVNSISVQGGISGIDILWQDLVDLLNSNSMEENAIYHIIDKRITLRALTKNTYSSLCQYIGEVIQEQIYDSVNDYVLSSGRNYRTHQIWDKDSTTILPSIVFGNVNLNGVIWNGKMWFLEPSITPISMDLTDEPGTSTMWFEIVRPSIVDNSGLYFFSNEQKGFDIEYDLIEDNINVVYDNRGNRIFDEIGQNQLLLTDFGCKRIYFNNCGAIYNNVLLNNNTQSIIHNSNTGYIYNNSNSGSIAANSNIGEIYNNSNNGHIIGNSNNGSITGNSNNGEISNNSNSGPVYSNSNIGEIYNNSNSGEIYNNSNSGSIYVCSNNGNVSGNTNIGEIYNNSNNGHINGNSNSSYISFNTNGGYIDFNSNSGEIYNNSNSGYIGSNTNTDSITYNSNSGTVYSNSNNGSISYNSNNGGISNLTNVITDVKNNINNGFIDGLSSPPGSITDPIVNK